MLAPCLFYTAKLDPNGYPIVGTMEGHKNHEQITDPCNYAQLPPYQMPIPAGKTQCFSPTGLRYFYHIRTDPKFGTIVVPNSLFSRRGKPKAMCVVNQQVVEFIKHS